MLQKLVPSGTHVRKGDVVAEFDRLYMLNRLDDYRDSVLQHEANVRKLNALLDVKRKAYEQQIRRSKADMEKAALELQKAPVLSANTVEKLRLNLEEAKARYQQISDEAKYVEISEKAAIRVTELRLERCRVQFAEAQRNVDRMIAKAPIDGMAVMQTIRRGSDTTEIQEGDQVAPGAALHADRGSLLHGHRGESESGGCRTGTDRAAGAGSVRRISRVGTAGPRHCRHGVRP